MNQSQVNVLTMGTAVSENLQVNASQYAGKPVFITAVALHDTNMDTIQDLIKKQNDAIDIQGLIHDKNMLKELMVFNATRIIAGIKGYGQSISNDQLIKSVSYSPTMLKRSNDFKSLAMFEKIVDVANTNATHIVDFGVTAGMITLLNNDCISFKDILKKPKQMRGVAAQITKDLAAAFSAMKLHLRATMDQLMRSNFLDTNFGYTYFRARKLYNIGTPATILEGTVITPEGHHLPKVFVEILNYPSQGINTTRITDSKGFYSFKKLEATNLKVRVRAVDYLEAEYDVKINKDKENKLDITLKPAPVLVPVTA